MSRRGNNVRRASARTTMEWASRGVLAVLIAAAAYVAVTQSLARALVGSDPEQAYSFYPGDGRIGAAQAATFAGPEASDGDRRQADRLARAALLRDPTAVAGAATLGLDAQARGDVAGARRLFAYAERLSRRDLQTQLWGIEDAVARGDIPGALRHYDVALRTNEKVADVLFPVLAGAAADPAVRTALSPIFEQKPAWSTGFIRFVAIRGTDPRAAAQILTAANRAGVTVPPDARSTVVNALIAAGAIPEAWRYYRTFRPQAAANSSRDPRFSLGDEAPSLFDWTPIGDASVTTSIQRGADGGIFDFAAPPGFGGPLLQQVQLLPPGDYQLQIHSIDIDQQELARPYWSLGCRGSGQELIRLAVPNSADADGRLDAKFKVPAGCTVQTLVLIARPSSALGGLSGQFDRVAITPLGTSR